MNANLVWRGDAKAVAQIVTLTPGAVIGGREYSLRINFKDITVIASGDSASDLMEAFVDAIEASDIPEWSEVIATNSNGVLVLTSQTPGVPFKVSALVSGFTVGAAIVVTVAHNPSGGTWHFDAGTYGAANIVFNESEAAFQSHMDGLFGAGNTLVTKVTGSSTWTYTIEFIGTLAGLPVPDVAVSYASLTGGDAALVATIEQAAVAGTNCVQTIDCAGAPTGGNRNFRFMGIDCVVAHNASAATLETALQTIHGSGAFTVTGTANVQYVITAGGKFAHLDLPAFEIISSALTGGTIFADATVVTNGVTGRNQISYFYNRADADTQAAIYITKTTPGSWSAGTWDLHIGADVASLAFDLEAYEIANALNDKFGYGWQVVSNSTEFIIRGIGDALDRILTPVSVVSTITGGSVALSHYDDGFDVDTGSDVSAYTLTIDGHKTATINPSDNQGILQSKVDAAIGTANSVVTFLEGTLANDAGLYQIEFRAAYGSRFVSVIIEYLSGSAAHVVPLIHQPNDTAGVNEVIDLQVHGSPTWGNFTATFGGVETAAIALDAGNVTVRDDFEALSSVGPGGFAVSNGPLPAATRLTAGAKLAFQDLGLITINDDGLKARVTITTPGVTGLNEIQRLSLRGQDVWAGTVTMTVAGHAVAAVNYNDALSAIVSALEGSAGLTAGDLSNSTGGPWPETDVLIEFGGSVAETAVALITATDTLKNGTATAVDFDPIIVDTTVKATGPNHFNEPVNWFNADDPTSARAPERGDTLYAIDGDVSMLYGLVLMVNFTADTVNDLLVVAKDHDLADGQVVEVWKTGADTLPTGLAADTSYYVVNLDPVTGNFGLATTAGGAKINLTGAGVGTLWVGVRINKFVTWSTWTGEVGLPWISVGGYKEYRALDLELGLLPAGSMLITVGQGTESGSSAFSIYTGPDQLTFECLSSAGSRDGQVRPAINWRGDNANAVMRLLGGSFGIAMRPTETATFKSLEQRGGQLSLGEVSFESLDKTGGSITVINAATMSGVNQIRG